ncbi:hypothetical protein D3C81_2057280 [compost metagenome]
MLMAWVGAGIAFVGIDLNHQQAVSRLAIRQNIVYQPLVTAFTPPLYADVCRGDQA